MVLPEPYFSLSDSRDTSCAIRFLSEPVPQLRDSWDNTWCYRKPRRYRFPLCKASNIMSHYLFRKKFSKSYPRGQYKCSSEKLWVKIHGLCFFQLQLEWPIKCTLNEMFLVSTCLTSDTHVSIFSFTFFCHETMSNCSQDCWIELEFCCFVYQWLFHIGVYMFAWFVQPPYFVFGKFGLFQ